MAGAIAGIWLVRHAEWDSEVAGACPRDPGAAVHVDTDLSASRRRGLMIDVRRTSLTDGADRAWSLNGLRRPAQADLAFLPHVIVVPAKAS